MLFYAKLRADFGFKFIAELGAEFYYPIAHVVNWNIEKNTDYLTFFTDV